jgi:prepilin-type N-terminal cleavage/methylation domain-containing protein/prepilin-type processing-associated H-X9-DG protein
MITLSPATPRRAFTLVELLVVIAIIGILMAMTLPAIQAARESGRRTQCRNNIKNQAAATLQHVSLQGIYPTGGWGYQWVGDADRGFSRRQPGGWQYNILPYMEETQLHDLGKGKPDADKKIAHGLRVSTPIAIFYCPTRRRPESFSSGYAAYNSNSPGNVARSDYAANGGSKPYSGGNAGPGASLLNSDDATIDSACNSVAISQNSPIYCRSELKPASVRDGASKTYLLGERHIRFDNYAGDTPSDDDQAWGVGYDQDVMRVTASPPEQDTIGMTQIVFGSAHNGAFNMALADGAVKSVSYEIDKLVHKSLGDRADGGPTDLSALAE